ncbi:hypothetical protein [Streptomyces sp. NPDC060187]|uniref:hypothetical protein n=1 Tax=Streptomyces sp. NPDC060187 TaxID=3347067 RepID=UPI0036461A42
MSSCNWKPCECGAKRDFMSHHNAEKALGKAQAKRTRRADAKAGTRRGLKIETRTYECEYGGYHLTSESRASYENRIHV